MKSAGGKLEAFYFAFGDTDAFVLVDAPDHATVAAASLAINSSGAVRTKTVVSSPQKRLIKPPNKVWHIEHLATRRGLDE